MGKDRRRSLNWNARCVGPCGPVRRSAAAARPAARAPGPGGLQPLGDDKVSEHVEGVAVRMHGHHLAVLLVDLKEPGIVQAHDPHLGPLLTSQADLLSTEKEAARGYGGCNNVG